MRTIAFLLAWGVATAQGATVAEPAQVAQDKQLAKAKIVDARGPADASRWPVPDALIYDLGMHTAEKRVVVIADDEAAGLLAARDLEQSNAGLTAVVLHNGYDGLRLLRPEAKLPRRDPGVMPTFTIPSDTCQQGRALHIFKGDK